MSKMQWFRLYNRMIDDEKLGLLAFEDRWHFVALCCLKSSELLDEEASDIRTRKVAYKLGVQVRELDEIARRLREVGLIDEDMNPIAWDTLQFKHETSTKRVREYRKRQKAKENQGGNGTKQRETVSETPPETETETETEVISPKGDCASEDALQPPHVCEKWNEVAKAIGRPTIRKLTPERRQLLKSRIAQNELEDFIQVFSKILASPFLRGDTGWKGCTFDWVFKKANFQKILEGNYDD